MIKNVSNYIPDLLLEKIDASGQALINYINNHDEELKDEILETRFFKLPERMPANFLDEMDHYLEADFFSSDSETFKRQKISNAVKTHQNRGTWEDDLKIIIDRISGDNSSFYINTMTDDAVFVGDGTEDPLLNWSTFGGDGLDDDLGKYWCGNDEVEIAGIVFIKVFDSLDDIFERLYPIDDIIQEIILNIANRVPAYYRVFLGYEDADGFFINLAEV